jgi:type IX secretion system PorP/SprF family membrane protein
MKKITLTLSLLVITLVSIGQQLHFMSQYLQHNSMLNPGAAGMSKSNFIGLSHRNQWSAFPGNPKTTMAYGDVLLEKYNAGVAGYVYRDETGPTSRTGIQMAYSKHIVSRDEKSRFGIGIELRGLQYAIDKQKLISALGDDPALGGASSKFGFDAGFGVYYTKERLSAGIAVSQLIQSKLQLASVPNSKTNGRLYRHYNFLVNYKIPTGDDIYLIPNALFRAVQNAPSEFELGMKLDYQDKIWVAVNYKFNQSYSLQTGFKIAEKVNFGYSYDAYNAPISQFDGGSGGHEVGIRYEFGKRY